MDNRDLTHFEKRACLSYWYPKTKHLPSPDTKFIEETITPGMLLEKGDRFEEATSRIQSVAEGAREEFGLPLFFRTGQTSVKRSWDSTCYLRSLGDIPDHVENLATYGHTADLSDRPLNVWAVREWLEIKHEFRAFGGLPIGREYRYFVQDGKIWHRQPYWPPEAIEGHEHIDTPEGWRGLLNELNREPPHQATTLAAKAGKSVKESFEHPKSCWSVDVCRANRGWMVTDMAPAEGSFFWDPKRRFDSLAHKMGGEELLNYPSKDR
jgi:hypothetical protein